MERIALSRDLVHVRKSRPLIGRDTSLFAPRREGRGLDQDPGDREAGLPGLSFNRFGALQPDIERLRQLVRVAEQL
jgi:hypothetical protein